jgi:hypothetical protein
MQGTVALLHSQDLWPDVCVVVLQAGAAAVDGAELCEPAKLRAATAPVALLLIQIVALLAVMNVGPDMRACFCSCAYCRVLLQQLMVLDFISLRTLQQLSRLPPQQLDQLDAWLADDLAAYLAAAAAAAAAVNSCTSSQPQQQQQQAGGRTQHPGSPDTHMPGTAVTAGSSIGSSSKGINAVGQMPEQLMTQWARHCNSWSIADASRWTVPPSRVVRELLHNSRLSWDAAAGRYVWHHGPPDAELQGPCRSSSSSSSSSGERAAQLQSRRHARNQGRLLLNVAAYMPPPPQAQQQQQQGGLPMGAAAAADPQLLCGGAVEFK